jgi:Uncharacterised MFS-type transporter YbfB
MTDVRSQAVEPATANYLGYLIGALAGIFVPGLARSNVAGRSSLVVVTAALALMPVTENTTVWLVLRLVAGGPARCFS